MASDDSLPTLKLLLIGPSGAGKSACESFLVFLFIFSCFKKSSNMYTIWLNACFTITHEGLLRMRLRASTFSLLGDPTIFIHLDADIAYTSVNKIYRGSIRAGKCGCYHRVGLQGKMESHGLVFVACQAPRRLSIPDILDAATLAALGFFC